MRYTVILVVVWRSDNTLVSINEVTLRRTRLVLGWVTESAVQLPVRGNRSQYTTSHPGQLSLTISVGRRNEYQPRGGDVKAGMVCGR